MWIRKSRHIHPSLTNLQPNNIALGVVLCFLLYANEVSCGIKDQLLPSHHQEHEKRLEQILETRKIRRTSSRQIKENAEGEERDMENEVAHISHWDEVLKAKKTIRIKPTKSLDKTKPRNVEKLNRTMRHSETEFHIVEQIHSSLRRLVDDAHVVDDEDNRVNEVGEDNRGPASGPSTRPTPLPTREPAPGPSPSTSTQPSGSPSASPTCQPVDLGVRLVGRYDGCEQDKVRMAWSGTGFVARIFGTGLSFVHDGPSIEYTILVDGQLQEKLVTTEGNGMMYLVASDLSEEEEHIIEVYRRSEASFGTIAISTIEVIGGFLLSPPPASNRLIEIFGDSISCGYGNEGSTERCPFSIHTQNHYMTYGAVLARSFDADLSTIAWSGRGVVSNYNNERLKIPDMIDFAVPGNVWDFTFERESGSHWDVNLATEPNLVLINLGTNDFAPRSTHHPTVEAFAEGYTQFLYDIRRMYPTTYILTIVGPLLQGDHRSNLMTGIRAAIDEYKIGTGDSNIKYHQLATPNLIPEGCNGHPSIATHLAIAAELQGVIETTPELGWMVANAPASAPLLVPAPGTPVIHDDINNCGCHPTACTEEVLNTDLGDESTNDYSTCTEFIEWHMESFGIGAHAACLAAGYHLPPCAPCNPENCPK